MGAWHSLVMVGVLAGLAMGLAAPVASAHTGVASGACPPSYPVAGMPVWVVAEGWAGPVTSLPPRAFAHADLVVRHPTLPSFCYFIGVKLAV